MSPTPFAGPAEHRLVLLRRIFLTIVMASSLLLIPWIAYLAVSLPDRYVAGQWKAAWVGFDVALMGLLGWTAWNAWQRRQMLVMSAVITATLLVCDAWFDVMLDWGTRGMWWSIATAALGELPLAALLMRLAMGLLRIMQQLRWAELGQPGDAPPLWRISFRELLTAERSNTFRNRESAP